MSYFRESFEYPPLKIFLNSNTADIINNRGDVIFNLNRTISLPNGVIGYISLNELTIPNTNYNITSDNNTLVLIDDSEASYTVQIDPGNYTVNDLMNAINADLATNQDEYNHVVVSYNDITSKYTFTHNNSMFMTIDSTSTMLNALGFESALDYDSTAIPTTKSIIKRVDTVIPREYHDYNECR